MPSVPDNPAPGDLNGSSEILKVHHDAPVHDGLKRKLLDDISIHSQGLGGGQCEHLRLDVQTIKGAAL